MTASDFNSIPSLDLADFNNGLSKSKSTFVKNLGRAFSEIGFVAIKNHGLDDIQQNELYQVVIEFFNLPQLTKDKYEYAELLGQRGYIGKMKEHAKGKTTPDLKEFYHIGQEDESNIPKTLEYPKNIFPDEIPEFGIVGTRSFKILENAGLKILRAIALYIGLEETYFDDKVRGGNSILRPIHYFPIDNPDSIPPDAVRAAEHTDINLITLLMGASADGLQVLRNDGQWIPITALPEQIVVNVGDMLSRLTNNKLKSTIHRVVNPPRDQMHLPRFSIPFFMHPKSNMDLSCLENCIDSRLPKLYPDITAGEFLNVRLKEIGF